MLRPVRGRGSHQGRCSHRIVCGSVGDTGEGNVAGRPGRGVGQGLEVWIRHLHGRQVCVVGHVFWLVMRHFPCRKWFMLQCRREAGKFSNPWEGSVVRLPAVTLHGSLGIIVLVLGSRPASVLSGINRPLVWPLAYILTPVWGMRRVFLSSVSPVLDRTAWSLYLLGVMFQHLFGYYSGCGVRVGFENLS